MPNPASLSSRDRWKRIGVLLAEPPIVLCTLATIGFIVASVVATDKFIIALFTVLASLAANYAGGIWVSRQLESEGASEMVVRGGSAVRGLRVLLTQIASLQQRTSVYLTRLAGEELNRREIQTQLEEVVEKCKTLEEQAVRAIEEWTDILPGVAVQTQIGVITELQTRAQDLEAEVRSLGQRAQEMQGRANADTVELWSRYQQARGELDRLRTSIANRVKLLVATGNVWVLPRLRDVPDSGDVTPFRAAAFPSCATCHETTDVRGHHNVPRDRVVCVNCAELAGVNPGDPQVNFGTSGL